MGNQVNFLVQASKSVRTVNCYSLTGRFKRIFVSYNAQTAFFAGSETNAYMPASNGKVPLDLVGVNPIQLSITGMTASLVHGVAIDYATQLNFGEPVFNQLIKYATQYRIDFFNPQTNVLEGYITVSIPAIG